MKKIAALILAILCMVSFTSCTGATQLDDRLIIQGIGIDVDGGEYLATIMYLDTDNKRDEAPGTGVIYSNGKTVMDALTNAVSQSGKEPLYGQNLFLIIGSTLAKQGIGNAMNFFANFYESRPTISIFISTTSAKNIMSTPGVTATIIDKLGETETASGRIILSNLKDFISDNLNKTSQPKTALIEREGDSVYTSGTAIFKNDKLVGMLSYEETLGALIILNDTKVASEVVTLEGEDVSFSISNCKTKIKTYISNSMLEFDIDIKAKVDIYELNEFKESIKKDIEKRVQNICDYAIEKCIKEYSADIFGFGKRVLQTDEDYYENVDDWEGVLKGARYNTSVEIELSNLSE